ncbi:hypothetical protein [Rathayibacter rathayi]|nr:hypothetical protein [Rathayibacter rathayi]
MSESTLVSWFLLMTVSVVLVTLVHPPRAPDAAVPLDARGQTTGA